MKFRSKFGLFNDPYRVLLGLILTKPLERKASSMEGAPSPDDEGEKPSLHLSFPENFENRVLPFVFAKSNEFKDANKNWATVDREKIATGLLTSEDIRPRFGSKRKAAAKSIGVTVTPFKPIRRHHGIPRWSNLIRNTAPDKPARIAHMMSHLSVGQDVMSLMLKVTYRKKLMNFWLPGTSEIIKLKEEVSKRLNLQPACFNVECKDEKGDWIIMNCNEDLRNHLQLFCSKGDQVVRLRAVDT